MTSIASLIQEHAADDAAAERWDAVAASLNAATLVVRDSTPVSYASLGREFGDEARQLVAGTIREAAKAPTPQGGELADAHTVLLDEEVGLTIDSDARQAIITQLAAAGRWPEALRDGILRSRKRVVSPAGNAGLGTVTADQCREAWAEQSRQVLLANLQSRWDAIKNEFGTAGHAAAVAELRAMADELGA